MALPAFKVTLVGNSGVGKTSFVNKVVLGKDIGPHNGTLGVEVHPFRYGGKLFNIWDTSAYPGREGLSDGYYLATSICLIFVDGTLSLEEREQQALKWRNDMLRVAPGALFKVVNTKADLCDEIEWSESLLASDISLVTNQGVNLLLDHLVWLADG